MKRSLALGLLGIACLILPLKPAPAWGFWLLSTGGPEFPARWSNMPGSLIEDGVRGLGGGLEYSVSPGFCNRLIPSFVEEVPPTCPQLRQSIQVALNRWTVKHPGLQFVDVSDGVEAVFQTGDQIGRSPVPGSEVDIFARSSVEGPRPRSYGGSVTAQFDENSTWVMGTNGRMLPGRAIAKVSLVVDTDSYFYLDPVAADGICRHFPSLMLFMGGVALGLGYPGDRSPLNWDLDEDPINRMMIDCANPLSGLRPSPNIDRRAVMASNNRDRLMVPLSLKHDDLGGRDFLYPFCDEDTVRPAAHLREVGELMGAPSRAAVGAAVDHQLLGLG
jgi:hypothetical protein